MAVLTVEAEKNPDFQGDENALAEEIKTECMKVVGIKPRMRILEAGALPRATHKAKRVVDERKSSK